MNEYPQKLVEQGVKTTVIAARTSRDEPAEEVLNGVKVHRILSDTSTAISTQPTRFGYRALKKLDNLCNDQDIDILHLSPFPALGAVLSPVPWLESPPITAIDVRHTAVRNRFFDVISRWGIRFQNYLVDQTIVIDEHVASSIFPDTSDIEILHLGADLEAFAPGNNPELRKSWGVDEDELVVGYTGSLHIPRQLHRLIHAFDRLHASHPETNLVIVGDGLDRERLESVATESDARDSIHFTGMVPYEQMPSYVRAFDIGFAYAPDTPQYRDQPLSKTVEFLATDLPVVATDTPGNNRYVTDEENGLLVDDRIDEYVEGLGRLVETPDLREAVADGARESVKKYDYKTIVEAELIPTYRQLLHET